jgi:hypothetical protein
MRKLLQKQKSLTVKCEMLNNRQGFRWKKFTQFFFRQRCIKKTANNQNKSELFYKKLAFCVHFAFV